MARSPAEATDFCKFNAADFSELASSRRTTHRVICADVAALDQMLVYNRFGSHNPFGMIFALTRDLVSVDEKAADGVDDITEFTAETCDSDLGTHAQPGTMTPGRVRLRNCKRPRPLTLRANVGDVLHVRVRNLLRRPAWDDAGDRPGYSETFCRQGRPGAELNGAPEDGWLWRTIVRPFVSEGEKHGEDIVEERGDRLIAAVCETGSQAKPTELSAEAADWPRTRGISFVIDGLRPVKDPDTGRVDEVCLGLDQVHPGEPPVDCYWHAEREGPFFINSLAAPAGGEGDGGSLVHGLFGSLAVEPQPEDAETSTQWYRSQTSRAAFDGAWSKATSATNPHARAGALNYEAIHADTGLPILNLLHRLGGERYELVHNELNAIIAPPHDVAFREFTVVFHDELKTFYTRNFKELGRFDQLAGVRDGFAINYGASGLGAMIIANRKGIGPAADCMECLYEEFFLESWANGDPALLESYSNDPSNVHHSYLNDPIVFRNYHAGPKETHVFHLHAHQWFSGNDSGRSAYLDSQTVAPRQGFTYEVYHGGLRYYSEDGGGDKGKGWWQSLGSGNRNRTIGDSIFHCHLYPHFAQGMWELWRVHDVLEDGQRRLPDGQAEPGLSVDLLKRDERGLVAPTMSRTGSVDSDGRYVENAPGTPIPALIPLPGIAAPLLPTYTTDTVSREAAVLGYPFFIAGEAGHRAPQAPNDIARAQGTDGKDGSKGSWLDGGLPRHVVLDRTERELGVTAETGDLAIDDTTSPADRRRVEDTLYRLTAKMLALGDFSSKLTSARIEVLDNGGEPQERAAMGFHHNGVGEAPLALVKADGTASTFDTSGKGYTSFDPQAPAEKAPHRFAVNGAPPKPGAPFADPCGAPDGYAGTTTERRFVPGDRTRMEAYTDQFVKGLDGLEQTFVTDPAMIGFRRYAASAVQVDIVTNRAGWHDPQGRINVLTADSNTYKNRGPSAREEPFFFRAYSGECVEFRHTNELPKELELDDFQVKTPTDTIGQHIHLVKFDVTSSDGSGNGFNYEDGTFAADELAMRLCAMLDPAATDPTIRDPSTMSSDAAPAQMTADEWNHLCQRAGNGTEAHWEPRNHHHWASPLYDGSVRNPRFQTTVQRWFADPILSIVEKTPSGTSERRADRTMRTVFTHDHFAPSSIQQHGFYAALVVEPAGMRVCPSLGGEIAAGRDCMQADETTMQAIAIGDERGTGTAKIVGNLDDDLHPDFREFALAIADFALLYDPTDGDDESVSAASGPMLVGDGSGQTVMLSPTSATDRLSPKGIATLVCEAQYGGLLAAGDPVPGDVLENLCGSNLTHMDFGGQPRVVESESVPPALVARGLITETEVQALRAFFAFVRYRAGFGKGLARPIAAPQRPESISVDHHDPYLVNYRGEPVPLRIGEQHVGEATEPEGEDEDEDDIRTELEREDESAVEMKLRREDTPDHGIGPEDGDSAKLVDDHAALMPRRPILLASADLGDPSVMSDVTPDYVRLAQNDAAVEAVAATDAESTSRTAFDCFEESHADVVEQFLRRAPGPVGGRPGGIEPPGIDPTLSAGLLNNIAGATVALDCSIRHQSEDPRGDLANVYRSQFDGDKTGPIAHRWHRDPVTPLLETYSDERIQIRLIQGAQEVQHTFNVEGMAWRRNIDQGYPSGADPLDNDYVEPTWWQTCHEHGRYGIADQHDRWRDGELKTTDDLGYFDKHSRYVARCNNLEGFTAAQEVGISEHFEFPSAPSRYAVNYRSVQNALNRAEAPVPGDEDEKVLDYLYHFGSLDAVWNGAWGLIRVYDKPSRGFVEDTTRRLETAGTECDATSDRPRDDSACAIDSVLRQLAEVDDEKTDDEGTRSLPMQSLLASCPAGAPRVESYAVAMPLPEGQSYDSWGSRLHDVDALALVHVPKDLVLRLSDSDGRVPLTKIHTLREAAMAYYRDEPFVARANAGDCLKLSIVNALATDAEPDWTGCGHAPNGDRPGLVRDCLGDAPMPKIVPLNVEPDWQPPNGGDEVDIPVTAHQKNRIDVRPSARMAFTSPVSMLTRGADAQLPFGVNPTTTVEPGEIHEGQYYLGLLRIDYVLIDSLFGATRADANVPVLKATRVCTELGIDLDALPGTSTDDAAAARNIIASRDPDYLIRPVNDNDHFDGVFPESKTIVARLSFDVLGNRRTVAVVTHGAQASRPLPDSVVANAMHMIGGCIDALAYRPGLYQEIERYNDTLDDQNQVKAIPIGAQFKGERAKAIHAIPYALGAMPLKPIGDLFNHLPHGLFGAIVVEPEGATYQGRSPVVDGSALYEPDRSPYIGAAHRGRGANRQITFTGPENEPRSLREYVLFYQDGLNLWDDDSRNAWYPEGSSVPLKIVRDCAICDDTYDFGEKAVSYRAPAFSRRLWQTKAPGSTSPQLEAHANLNRVRFGDDFYDLKDRLWSNSLRLWAKAGEEVLVRVVHPGGRARQRAFVTVGNDYDDVYPGFGFPHASLLAPGKAVSAAFSAPLRPGCYMWSDGPRHIFASGAWGLLDVLTDRGGSSCGFHK
ncbi:hypothetical protein [Acuticoccus mangrovi]|uniref:Plastocyanin-like domain-containing protein n=1 Tax=Acuticoccus mangrovi TaxID=2796142 RepID=A0A934IR04_9HYPH|nr:hypothetical protein [Acuticoccus mangrovi]MBJ3777126.1 hypothetical protein [Acuticoccus mangrovi]